MIVDKRGLGILLAAVEVAQKILQRFSSDLQAHDQHVPGGLGRQYGAVRRLRDLLRNCSSAADVADSSGAPLQTEVELSEDDANLLASCLVHALPDIDDKLRHPQTSRQDRPWLDKQRQMILDFVRTLISVPVAPLIGQIFLKRQTESVRTCLRLCKDDDADPVGSEKSEKSENEEGEPDDETDRFFGGGDGAWGLDASTADDTDRERQSELDNADGRLRHKAALDRDELANMATREPHLFPPDMIQDQRLRVHARLSLHDLSQAKRRKNLRLTLVLLGSLLECVLIDRCLPCREEFNLNDPPDKWNFRALATKLLELTEKQKDLISLLLVSHKLLSPSYMLVQPRFIVTGAMVKDAEAFTRWVLKELGYQGRSEMPTIKSSHVIKGIWRSTNTSDDESD